MATPDDADDLVREGEEALDEGDADDALRCFEEALRADPDHWAAALGRCESLLYLWEIDEGLTAVQSLRPDDGEDDADRADLEARLLEAAGEFAAADMLFAEAARLDPQHFPRPIRTTGEDFRAILDDVLQGLPKKIRDILDKVPVTVEAKPSREMAEHAPHVTPEILGLFVGSPIGERASGGSGYPEVVILFQRNLERSGFTRADVAREIRITLLHEYGHYLGFEEEDMERLGLA